MVVGRVLEVSYKAFILDLTLMQEHKLYKVVNIKWLVKIYNYYLIFCIKESLVINRATMFMI